MNNGQEFDGLLSALEAVYRYKKGIDKTSISTSLIRIYEAAGLSYRVRLSKGFPYLAEALALVRDKGDEIYILNGLMERVDDETDKS